MSLPQSGDTDLILVNRTLFTEAISVLEQLIQAGLYNLSQVRKTDMDKESKTLIIHLLEDQIKVTSRVSHGLEMSVDIMSEPPSGSEIPN